VATNPLTIPAPRVPPVDPKTGEMSPVWYRFFMEFFRGVETATVPDVQAALIQPFYAPADSDDRIDGLERVPYSPAVDTYYIGPVWEDVQFPVSSGKTSAVNAPSWEAFTTNTSGYSFAVDDFIDLASNELPHSWQEGTTGHFHLHVTTKAANTSGANRYAKFTVYVAYAGVGDVYVETSGSAELTIPTGTAALTHFLVDVLDLAFTGKKIGSQVRVRIKRIAATGGTEYSGNIFINQCGAHILNNTTGSREIAIK